jgi:hypothetical protein
LNFYGTKGFIVATPLWGKCEDETHTPKNGYLEQFQSLKVEGKTPCLEVFIIPLERPWSVDVENDLAWAVWTSAA